VAVVEEEGRSVERPKYIPYDLRHFFASMLIEKKVNLKQLQTLMGHTNIQTTLDVYGHLLEEETSSRDEDRGMLSGMLNIRCGESVPRSILTT
jgi:integrase